MLLERPQAAITTPTTEFIGLGIMMVANDGEFGILNTVSMKIGGYDIVVSIHE